MEHPREEHSNSRRVDQGLIGEMFVSMLVFCATTTIHSSPAFIMMKVSIV